MQMTIGNYGEELHEAEFKVVYMTRIGYIWQTARSSIDSDPHNAKETYLVLSAFLLRNVLAAGALTYKEHPSPTS
ncbi:hypothetical protein N7456_006376 [Penicillium angulare]|uniref:Uncharacterized protein n=1 Tax=Penicillium angulare TaxID=116970 RepID=A0A9W9FHP1_9EURO|nr:hypothetical protein N7456_006376 [Penicillium angulare]